MRNFGRAALAFFAGLAAGAIGKKLGGDFLGLLLWIVVGVLVYKALEPKVVYVVQAAEEDED